MLPTFRYSYNTLSYHDENVSASIERLTLCGYDGIELAGDTTRYEINEVRRACETRGIAVSSICSLFSSARDFSHPDPDIRRTALSYVKEMIDFAAAVGAPLVIVAPSANMRTTSLSSPKRERDWALQGLYEAANYAEWRDIQLSIEPWNRYETHWVNRLEQALDLAKRLEVENVGVMGDTFHMNIEEGDMATAIREAGALLNHFHVADSTRLAPGTGHIDFTPILRALIEVGYAGFVTFELLPAASQPFAVLAAGGDKIFKEEYTRQSIDALRLVELQLRASVDTEVSAAD